MKGKFAELLQAVDTMRNAQVAYFASRKESRYGDKRALALSKKLEGEVDRLVAEGITALLDDVSLPVNKARFARLIDTDQGQLLLTIETRDDEARPYEVLIRTE